MKKTTKELKQKTLQELIKEENNLRDQITKLELEFKVKAPKDKNTIMKKRKRLAQVLTIFQENNS